MLCQNCNKRPAAIHLFTKVNGQSREIDLCQQCYQKLRNEQGNINMNNNNEFFGDFDDLFNALNGNNRNAANNMNNNGPEMQMGRGGNGGGQGGRSLLDQYGTDLTALAKRGKIDPVIGRDQEIARVIEILNRRTKNNPVLIGEAGVGKTAVVEGLAQQIVDGSVPAKLQDKKIISLNVVSLVQGTGIRGQFEQRMEQLIKELQSRNDVILFIDEIHEIVGAGNAEGGMDAGNIIKPALARGELQLVGAT
ncbi:MAG: AAA family ATPase, partial [Lactobacillus sp.]|nr:AAA family ATPase [Lactobacillus sp.]